jgi:hypothetical protein
MAHVQVSQDDAVKHRLAKIQVSLLHNIWRSINYGDLSIKYSKRGYQSPVMNTILAGASKMRDTPILGSSQQSQKGHSSVLWLQYQKIVVVHHTGVENIMTGETFGYIR